MTPAPTLRQVADLAGVSIKTVSRVINDDHAVAAPTAARVRSAIAALAYRPNPFARSLRTGHDDALGLVVESIGDPFFAAVTEAVEDAARARGLFLIIASASTVEQERAVVEGLLHRSVCGLVLVPSSLDYGSHPLRLHQGAIPVVFVDRPPTGLQADTVLIENEEAAFTATSHLLAYGHRRIGLVLNSLEIWTVRNRFDGYRRALAAASIPYDERLVVARRRRDDLVAALAALLDGPEPPTALLSTNATASIPTAHTLHVLGRTDVAFVSFDDFDTADALIPAVTVVRQDPAAMGRLAAELLFERLDGDVSPPRRVLVQAELVPRGSGELLAPGAGGLAMPARPPEPVLPVEPARRSARPAAATREL